MDDGKDDEAAQSPALAQSIEDQAFDPLLDSFADRYVFAWEQRGLGRVDSPINLRPSLEEAAELFERGRQGWRTFEILVKGGKPRAGALRDFEGKEWDSAKVEEARRAHLFLLTHTSFDLAKPDELPLLELGEWLVEEVPNATLYASVAMRCAVDAADECHRLSRTVEDCARHWYKVDLAALHKSDNDLWLDRIRDVLRELAGEVAEAREYVAIYLGAARTALALASAAENAENLYAAERDYVELWEQHEADKLAVRADGGATDDVAAGSSYFTRPLIEQRKPSPEMTAMLAEKAALKRAIIKRRAKDKEATDRATRGKIERAKKTRVSVDELFKQCRAEHLYWSDDQVCESVGAQIGMHKTTVRNHARALGLLSGDVSEKVSEKTARNANTAS
jgi:hypothetical protein